MASRTFFTLQDAERIAGDALRAPQAKSAVV
jgi:hypothetical protein